MLRTIIIDDEPSAIEVITLLLKMKCPADVEVIATSTSPHQGRKLIDELAPNLVFMDIEMPGMSGIELASLFPKRNFNIIFITAYDDYAIKAFKVNAIDYILKPVNSEELVAAVEKVKSSGKNAATVNNDQLRTLQQLLLQSRHPATDLIGIGMADKIQFVNVQDIGYCEAKGSYTYVYLKDGTKVVASKSLGEFETLLAPAGFFRIHHSSLINLRYIKEFQRQDGGYVVMNNSAKLEVSVRKRKDFLQAVNHIIV